MLIDYIKRCKFRHMDLRTFLASMTPEARDDFAARVGVSVGHLRNIAYGSKPCSAEHAIAIEVASGSRVRVEPLCPGLDWAAFWAGRAASAC